MVKQFLIGGHKNFVYLITHAGQSLVVDPQSDLTPWQGSLKEQGSTLVGVLLTHTHWDHVAGVPAIVDQYQDRNLPIYLNELDARRMNDSAQAIKGRFVFVKDGDAIALGSLKKINIQVLHTPGHSAGESSYFITGEKGEPSRLFTGDTVFVGDVGRTDLETGSTTEMFDTIQRLKTLADNTIIYPGHDYGRTPTTTIAREREESAAFRCGSVKELDALP